MKEETTSLAPALRVAVWNWVDQYPEEFNEAMRTRGGMEGAPERVFDLLFPLTNSVETNKVVWPTLAILNAISSDRLSPDLVQRSASSRAKSARPVRRGKLWIYTQTLTFL
jgi:neurofibromin 1